ncbi:hypothetical protein [Bacillus bombysepticus]|uniref:hypothetical protein n=1 Tax=Bacillus bombysepticus TaxID=658666 RepID=UPI00301AB8F2
MAGLYAMEERIIRIRNKVLDKGLELNECLTASELSLFEKENDVILPEECRLFLTKVGNGGAGPYYGLLSVMKANVEEIKTEILEGHDRIEDFEGKIMRLCHEGCGCYQVVVLTGDYKGMVWIDNRASDSGLVPLLRKDGSGLRTVGLLEWYEEWIDSGAKGMKDMFPEIFENTNLE